MVSDVVENPTSDKFLGENLKAIKHIHQLLMVICGAILAFAVRTDSFAKSKLALKELAALREISLQTYPSYLSKRYKDEGEQNNKFVMAVIREAGLPVLGHPVVEQPVFSDPPPDLNSAKLSAIHAFFSSPQKIGTAVLDGDKKYLSQQLAKNIATRNPNPRIVGVSISGLSSPGYFGLREWVNTSQTGPASIAFVISDQPQTIPNTPVAVLAAYSIRAEDGDFPLEWLKTIPPGRELIDTKTNMIFPHLNEFWERVNALSVDQATLVLQEEMAESTRGTLSFFGVPVDRSLVVWVGPAVCFSIIFFLAFHIRHLRLVRANTDTIKYYPWIIFFRGTAAYLMAIGTLLLLPASANILLLSKFGLRAEWSTRSAYLFTTFMVLSSIWSLVEIFKVRRTIYPRWE